MSFDKITYLHERIYVYSKKKIDRTQTEYKLLSSILGEDVLEKMLKGYKNLIPFINNEQYANIDINCNGYLECFSKYMYSAEIKKSYNCKYFTCFFSWYLGYAEMLFKKKYACKNNFCQIEQRYQEYVCRKIENVCIRVLIWEINSYREKKVLRGKNSEEEYTFFNESFKNQKRFHDLLEKYPVMHRQCLEIIHSTFSNIELCLQRFEKDTKIIVKSFFPGETSIKITDIIMGVGDVHQNGEEVLIIALNNKEKIIYKPRTGKNEIIYAEILNLIGNSCNLKMKTASVQDMGEYSWHEYIKSRECKDIKEVKEYYQRVGVILFIHYILGTKDIHFENFVAFGKYPVVIDIEMMLAPEKKGKIEGGFSDSVLESGILPFGIWKSKDNGGTDFSAINGTGKQLLPFKTVVIENANRSDIKIGYVNAYSNSNMNLVRVNGKFIKSQDFVKDIIRGFESAYMVTLKEENARKIVNLFKNKRILCRYLLRDTQVYSMYLRSSFHPFILRDGGIREMLFARLMKQATYSDGIVPYEIKMLLNGAVPYFYFDSSERNLRMMDGSKIDNYFVTTANENLEKKIEKLNLSDLQFQKQLIVLTLDLSSLAKNPVQNVKVQFKNNKLVSSKNIRQLAIEGVEKIADKICESAYTKKDISDISFIDFSISHDTLFDWNFHEMDPYFYDGYSGILFFMNIVSMMIKSEKYKKISRLLKEKLFKYTDNLCGSRITLSGGAYTGEISIVYAYQLLFLISDNHNYLDYAEKHITVLCNNINPRGDADLVNGDAGVIILSLNMYRFTKKTKYIHYAEEVANYLIAKLSEMDNGCGWKHPRYNEPLAGLSHGCSGIAMSLAYLYNISKDKRYLPIIENLVNYENTFYDHKALDWIDIRSKKLQKYKKENVVSWCHGSGGILLSRIVIQECISESPCNEFSEYIFRDYERALYTVRKNIFRTSNCLCHGTLGNFEILRKSRVLYSDEKIYFMYMCYINHLLDDSDTYYKGYKLDFTYLGLMQGLAGIGYSLACFLDKDIPSILMPVLEKMNGHKPTI